MLISCAIILYCITCIVTSNEYCLSFLQRIGPKMLDHEGKEVPGNRGYKYDHLNGSKSVFLMEITSLKMFCLEVFYQCYFLSKIFWSSKGSSWRKRTF